LLVPITGENNIPKPDFKVTVPFTPEKEKELDESDGKADAVKLALETNGEQIVNPTIQVQPIFNQGKVE
jgi:hypothetical protein